MLVGWLVWGVVSRVGGAVSECDDQVSRNMWSGNACEDCDVVARPWGRAVCER